MSIPSKGHEHVGTEQQNGGLHLFSHRPGNQPIIRAAQQQIP
jgi:hypothetical protein